MLATFDIRPVPLGTKWFRDRAESFLESCGLHLDEGLDLLAGVYDAEDNLVGCGGLDGNILKCLALTENVREQNLSSTLVSRLYSIARDEGAEYISVFTKPENEAMFRSMGFHHVGSAPEAVMMQSSARPLASYLDYLRTLPRGRENGVIVMNVNPMTRGHFYLIRTAAAMVDRLTVIPVADNDATNFSYSDRRTVLIRACARLRNVTVAEGSDFAISASTFPSYFHKRKSDASQTHIALDLDIFCRHIAPALGATVRFAGSEPSDPLTAAYNDGMREILPSRGLRFIEIPRMEKDGEVVSASCVRAMLDQGNLAGALAMAHPAASPLLFAKSAVRALRMELDLTPKPGLVDRHDNGSHRDMDHALMLRSIETLEPWFVKFAETAAILPFASCRKERTALLVEAGVYAEKEMLRATGGVNTHRGAIFAVGLTLASAAAFLASHGRLPDEEALSREISEMAALIPKASGSHGAEMASRYGTGGARQAARSGYDLLFSLWLPARRRFLAENPNDSSRVADLKTLLLIISTLNDSNALYRAGKELADLSRIEASDLLENFSIEAMRELNDRYVERNISHGGAADMLALTILVDSILSQ